MLLGFSSCNMMLQVPRNETNVTSLLIYRGNRMTGAFLTDQVGNSLYMNLKDTPKNSTCYGAHEISNYMPGTRELNASWREVGHYIRSN